MAILVRYGRATPRLTRFLSEMRYRKIASQKKKIEKQYFDIEKGYKKVRSKRALLFYIWMRKNVQGVEKCLSSRNLKKKS